MKYKVYIETSIPSFYYEIRTARKSLHVEIGHVNGGINLDKIMNSLPVMRSLMN